MEHLTREEILGILASMGISLPSTTKLSDESLDKRLCDALNASQYKSKLPATLASLKPWPIARPAEPSRPDSRSLLDNIGRGNAIEASRRAVAREKPTELYVNVFSDLRQTVAALANLLDKRYWVCLIQDPSQMECAIAIRVSDTYIV